MSTAAGDRECAAISPRERVPSFGTKGGRTPHKCDAAVNMGPCGKLWPHALKIGPLSAQIIVLAATRTTFSLHLLAAAE
eukprot:scaffold36783_cov68-Phaeocystis_antarctica.AAC.5